MNARYISVALALAACLLAAGCKDSPSAGAPVAGNSKPGGEAVSVSAIAAQAKGFTVGSEMTVRRVFVFFDAQCPHCAALWQAAKPLKSQARFVWVPVGLLNNASTTQGAALLAAADPIAAMDLHEASMRNKQGGITAATGDTDTQKAAVASNTQLFNRYAFTGVPVVVANHASTGALVTREGSLSTAALADALGLQVPAGAN